MINSRFFISMQQWGGFTETARYETTGLLPDTVTAISVFKVHVSTTEAIRRLLGSQGLKHLPVQTPKFRRLRQKRSNSVRVYDYCQPSGNFHFQGRRVFKTHFECFSAILLEDRVKSMSCMYILLWKNNPVGWLFPNFFRFSFFVIFFFYFSFCRRD